MINDFIREAFDIESNAFKKMWGIIREAEFETDGNGKELHHIVPVTFFAQKAIASLNNPYLGGIGETEICRAIRNSDSHYCNESWNVVYLSAEDHNKVHALMQECAADDWITPHKGASIDTNDIVAKKDGDFFRNWKFDHDINLVAKSNPNAKFILHADKTATIKAGNTIKSARTNSKHNKIIQSKGLMPGNVVKSDLHVSCLALALDAVLGYVNTINDMVIEEETGKTLRELKCD